MPRISREEKQTIEQKIQQRKRELKIENEKAKELEDDVSDLGDLQAKYGIGGPSPCFQMGQYMQQLRLPDLEPSLVFKEDELDIQLRNHKGAIESSEDERLSASELKEVHVQQTSAARHRRAGSGVPGHGEEIQQWAHGIHLAEKQKHKSSFAERGDGKKGRWKRSLVSTQNEESKGSSRKMETPQKRIRKGL